MNAITKASDVGIVREGFGETEKRGETASTMLAAQAQAAIQARYVMALQRPRNMDGVRVRLLRECERPGFAERAFYSLPRKGAKPGRLTRTPGRIEGLSVRFAEAAIRLLGNIAQSTRTIYDDDYKRLVNVSATDLETNAVYERDVVLEKTVERREIRDGDVVLGQRTNSTGAVVFVVQTTEADLLTKESALVSRMFRTEALRFLPSDIAEECEKQIVATVQSRDAKDPDCARKAVCDAFATVNVSPEALALYLGHDLALTTPQELTSLRGLFAALRDGQVTWADVLAEKDGERPVAEGKPDADKPAPTKASKVADAIKARAAAKGAKGNDPQPPAGAAPAASTGPSPDEDDASEPHEGDPI